MTVMVVKVFLLLNYTQKKCACLIVVRLLKL